MSAKHNIADKHQMRAPLDLCASTVSNSRAESEATPAAPGAVARAIHSSLVGEDEVIHTVFGARKQTYVDYTASGRSLDLIEDYLRSEVLPVYGNTHTIHSYTGFQTTHFREEARSMVANAVMAGPQDLTLFAGTGATGAIEKLIRVLDVHGRGEAARLGAEPTPIVLVCPYAHHSNILGWQEAGAGTVLLPEASDGGVHLGALEAALLASWGVRNADRAFEPSKAAAATVRDIRAAVQDVVDGIWDVNADVKAAVCGHVCGLVSSAQAIGEQFEKSSSSLASIAPQLQRDAQREVFSNISRRMGRLRIGALSAASNVSGACNPVDLATALLRTYGALAVWDYAAAAPHVGIQMNPTTPRMTGGDEGPDAAAWPRTRTDVHIDFSRPGIYNKDAIAFSTHKFPGGPGTPGVLVLKHALLMNKTPSTPGGGTVFFVKKDGSPRYLANEIERHEGGTPDIVGAIRAGLVLHLAAQVVGFGAIESLEGAMNTAARQRWAAHPNIRVAGPAADTGCPSVGIISLEILAPAQEGRQQQALHWGFATTLLNDLFGIQCRGGCLCAGPYSQQLLHISDDASEALEAQLLRKAELLRPGFVRVGLSYHLPQQAFDFIVSAVEWVADNAWHLMREYTPVADSGEWRHVSLKSHSRPKRSLQNISFSASQFEYRSARHAWHEYVAGALPDGIGGHPALQDGQPTPEAEQHFEQQYFATADKLVRDIQERPAAAHIGEDAFSDANLGLSSPRAKSLCWFALPGETSDSEALTKRKTAAATRTTTRVQPADTAFPADHTLVKSDVPMSRCPDTGGSVADKPGFTGVLQSCPTDSESAADETRSREGEATDTQSTVCCCIS